MILAVALLANSLTLTVHGIGDETGLTESSISENSEVPETNAEVIYDTQPSTLEEVQAAINAYEAEYSAVLASDGFLAALNVQKPHWEFEVTSGLMPSGYHCELVDYDTNFGEPYYTFFVGAVALAGFSGGNGTLATPYVIATEQDLKDLATDVNGGNAYSGVYFELKNDITLTSAFAGIGYANSGYIITSRPFRGTFNGNGNTIKNLYGTSGNTYGLFGYTDGGAVITDLNVELGGRFGSNSSTSISGDCHGVIIGVARNTTIKGCNVDGKGYTIAGGYAVGGIIGYAKEYVTIEDCITQNITVQGYAECGGIAGRAGSYGARVSYATAGYITIRNCTVDNITSVTGEGYAAGFIGIGECPNATYGTNFIEDCSATNVKTTSGVNYSAGFAGALRQFTVTNCSATNSTSNGHSYIAGFAGVIYNGSEVTWCYSEDNTIAAQAYAGGFSGAIYNDLGVYPSHVMNCYSAGGSVTQTTSTYYSFGGFAGTIYDQAVVENCYAQTDVTSIHTNSTWGGTGGFVGTLGLTGTAYTSTIKNCYSTGSVTSTQDNNLIGSFIGLKITANPKITNSYATGTVTAPSGTVSGGFAGHVTGANSITSCFFDTTTTRRDENSAVGSGSTSQGITGFSTKVAIDLDNNTALSAWGVTENFLGAAKESGGDSKPWYIDDDVTYPYFYYQYDDHSREETNYNLQAVKYQNGTALGQKRADFKIQQNSLPFKVKSIGAVKAYFPYLGTSRFDISTTSDTNVPDSSFSYNTSYYSLGSVSKTNIISFGNLPYAEKTNNRSTLHSDTNDYKTEGWTYVGDTVTYTITVSNYSTEADWKNVVLKDQLAEGVTVTGDAVYISYDSGGTWAAIPTGDSTSNKPYYTYDADDDNILHIYLEDMAKITESGEITTYTIKFDAFIGEDAATDFTLPEEELAELDNIRNTGTVIGDLVYEDGSADKNIEAPFDDEDTDPVYDTYKVVYHGNGGKTPGGADTVNKGYYIYQEGFTILGNSDTSFSIYDGAVFKGWNTKADGTGDNYTVGQTYTFDWQEDLHLYAQWEYLGSITIKKYGDRDGDAALSGAVFRIEQFKGTDPGSETQLADDSNWEAIYWNDTDSEWVTADTGYVFRTDGDNGLVFSNLPEGTYRITETTPPSSSNATYSLLKDPIVVTIPYTIDSSNPDYDTVINKKTPDKTVTEGGVTTAYYYNLTYTVTDAAVIELPAAGSINWLPNIFIIVGIAILNTAAGCCLYYRRRSRMSNHA